MNQRREYTCGASQLLWNMEHLSRQGSFCNSITVCLRCVGDRFVIEQEEPGSSLQPTIITSPVPQSYKYVVAPDSMATVLGDIRRIHKCLLMDDQDEVVLLGDAVKLTVEYYIHVGVHYLHTLRMGPLVVDQFRNDDSIATLPTSIHVQEQQVMEDVVSALTPNVPYERRRTRMVARGSHHHHSAPNANRRFASRRANQRPGRGHGQSFSDTFIRSSGSGRQSRSSTSTSTRRTNHNNTNTNSGSSQPTTRRTTIRTGGSGNRHQNSNSHGGRSNTRGGTTRSSNRSSRGGRNSGH